MSAKVQWLGHSCLLLQTGGQHVLIDPFLMPIILAVVATLLKGVLSGIVSALFGIASSGFVTFTGRIWIEMGYNGVVAPFLFALLNLFRVFKQADKEGA